MEHHPETARPQTQVFHGQPQPYVESMPTNKVVSSKGGYVFKMVFYAAALLVAIIIIGLGGALAGGFRYNSKYPSDWRYYYGDLDYRPGLYDLAVSYPGVCCNSILSPYHTFATCADHSSVR